MEPSVCLRTGAAQTFVTRVERVGFPRSGRNGVAIHSALAYCAPIAPMIRRVFAAKPLFASALLTMVACEPDVIVGKWICPGPSGDKSDAISSSWSTSFEREFCDYERVAGFCYADEKSSFETVTSPVHSGRYAAAFRVGGDPDKGVQARCVRQGVLPEAAYYGAWYFIPALATNSNVWNLIHFQGGDTSTQHGLWDISLINSDGGLRLVVFGFLHGFYRESRTLIPIGTWFHLQLYLKRAADTSGEIALYVDGRQQFEAKNVITDDSEWGQWYVGNYADALVPSNSTLYVDDITIGSTL